MKYDQYKTFNELSEEAKKKVIRTDHLFTVRNNFLTTKMKEIRKQLYKIDGSVACMTIEERKRWGNK